MKKSVAVILVFLFIFAFTGCQTAELDFGIENASTREASEIVTLAENIEGQVLLLAEDSNEENGQVAAHHLAIVLDDKKIVRDLSNGGNQVCYDGDITLCDFDGDGDMEIVLQETVGITGGYGNYLSRVFDFVDGEIVEIFSSNNGTEDFDTGFSIIILVNQEFKIENAFTNYSEVFHLENRAEEYYDFWYDENDSPRPLSMLVDSFYEFIPQDVDNDGVYEIKGRQYTSLVGHADGIGIATTVLKYNKEKAAFEVVRSSFEVLE